MDSHTDNIAAIFSTRLALSGYEGALIRVRRSSDNSETDVYPDASGYVSLSSDTGSAGSGTSFGTWAGSNTAYVTTIYNQNGATNAVQTSSSQQFKIVESGTLHVGTNGEAAFKVEENTNHMTASISRATPDAAWVRARVDAVSGNKYMLEAINGNDARRALVWLSEEFGLVGGGVMRTSIANDGNVHVVYGLFNGASSQAGVDTTYEDGNTGSGGAAGINIGNYFGEASQYASIGYIQEVVLWDGAPSDSDRNDVQSNINTFAAEVEEAVFSLPSISSLGGVTKISY